MKSGTRHKPGITTAATTTVICHCYCYCHCVLPPLLIPPQPPPTTTTSQLNRAKNELSGVLRMNNALEDECDDKKRLVRRLQVTRFQQKVLFVPMGSRGLGILMCCHSFLLFCVYLSAVGFESIGKGQGPRTRAFVGRSIASLCDPNIWLEHFGKHGLIQTFFFLYTRCPLLGLKCYVNCCLQLFTIIR